MRWLYCAVLAFVPMLFPVEEVPSRLAIPQSPAPAVGIHNGFVTGQEFLEMPPLEQTGYVMGVVDGMQLAPLFGAPRRLHFTPKEMTPTTPTEWVENCVAGMTNFQVVAIFKKYLNDHPEIWHESAHSTAFTALKVSCP
jgi:hypothetical protein